MMTLARTTLILLLGLSLMPACSSDKGGKKGKSGGTKVRTRKANPSSDLKGKKIPRDENDVEPLVDLPENNSNFDQESNQDYQRDQQNVPNYNRQRISQTSIEREDGYIQRSNGYQKPRATVSFVAEQSHVQARAQGGSPVGQPQVAQESNQTTEASSDPRVSTQDRPAYFNETVFDRDQVEEFFLNIPNRKREIWKSVGEQSRVYSDTNVCEPKYNSNGKVAYFLCDRLFTPEKAAKLTKRYVDKRGLSINEFYEFQEITYYLADIREDYNDDIFVFEMYDGAVESFLQDITGNEENMGAINLAGKFTKKSNDKWDFPTFKKIYQCIDGIEIKNYGRTGHLKNRRAAVDRSFDLMRTYLGGRNPRSNSDIYRFWTCVQ